MPVPRIGRWEGTGMRLPRGGNQIPLGSGRVVLSDREIPPRQSVPLGGGSCLLIPLRVGSLSFGGAPACMPGGILPRERVRH